MGSAGAVLSRLRTLSERHLRRLALAALCTGIGLGLYTGVLISANAARPFWNNVLLAPIFLTLQTVILVAAPARVFAQLNQDEIDAGLHD